MLDTGIDVPEIANLVFFKPVYSKIKFWQMIGRGTRLCPVCSGRTTTSRISGSSTSASTSTSSARIPRASTLATAPLGTRLFRARVQLLGHVQTSPELDPDAALRNSLADGLHGEVAAMNRENFIVRMHLEAVERFEDRAAWEQLSDKRPGNAAA
jgi:type I restriction enzyme, R subunit